MADPTTEQSVEEAPTSLSLLASQHFGNDFTGEVKREEVTETPEVPEETPEELEAEAPSEDAETEEVSASEEEAEEEISSLEELIQSQEWDPEWFDKLSVPLKIDGETKAVSFAELKAERQKAEAADRRLEEAKQIKETARAEIAAEQEKIQQNLIVTAKLIERAESELSAENEKIDWDTLKREDPAEWSAKKLELKERRQTLDDLKTEALSEFQQAQSQNQEKARQTLNAVLAEEGQRLIEKIPEWGNQDTASAEKAKLGKFLLDNGFSQEEVSQAYDHRIIVLARKAMLFDEKNKSLEPAKKKLAKVVKKIPPGSKKSESQINQERLSQAKSRLKRSGSLDDAMALLKARTGN